MRVSVQDIVVVYGYAFSVHCQTSYDEVIVTIRIYHRGPDRKKTLTKIRLRQLDSELLLYKKNFKMKPLLNMKISHYYLHAALIVLCYITSSSAQSK